MVICLKDLDIIRMGLLIIRIELLTIKMRLLTFLIVLIINNDLHNGEIDLNGRVSYHQIRVIDNLIGTIGHQDWTIDKNEIHVNFLEGLFIIIIFWFLMASTNFIFRRSILILFSSLSCPNSFYFWCILNCSQLIFVD